MADYRVFPGSMGVAALAIDVFGAEHVDAGTWMSPVRLLDVSEQDAETFHKMLQEQMPEAQIAKER